MDKPKVLIATPTYIGKKYVIDEWVSHIKKFTYDNYELVLSDNTSDNSYINYIKEKYPEIKVLKCTPTGALPSLRIRDSRNQLRDYFLENDFDYFFSLEQDIFPPLDIIERLIEHNRPIIGGWYIVGNWNAPCVSTTGMAQSHIPIIPQIPSSGLMKVFMMGLGCTLIKKEVLKVIRFTVRRYVYEGTEYNIYDDSWFYQDCQDRGIDVYLDCSIKCRHIQNENCPSNNQ